MQIDPKIYAYASVDFPLLHELSNDMPIGTPNQTGVPISLPDLWELSNDMPTGSLILTGVSINLLLLAELQTDMTPVTQFQPCTKGTAIWYTNRYFNTSLRALKNQVTGRTSKLL